MPSIINATTTNGVAVSGDTSGALALQTNNGTTAVTIDTSQNVGIGTASPGVKLHVAGDGYTSGEFGWGGTGAGANSLGFLATTGGNTAIGSRGATALLMYTNGAERMRIGSDGKVTLATETLYITNIPTTATAGNCLISAGEGNKFYRSTSALKYKQDIRDIESIDINKFRPVRYKSKCENDDQTKDHFGIVADEVHEAGLTELIHYGVDGEIEGFQYERLTVVLVKAIQELKAELDATKAEVQALKGVA